MQLPLPLILLVHLHILNYPHANEPQYDDQIFNPRLRGLKDRTKIMEDICYFLVGQLELAGARNILPMYPCVQPADSLAFRTSVSKYLEALRHRVLFSATPTTTVAFASSTSSSSSHRTSVNSKRMRMGIGVGKDGHSQDDADGSERDKVMVAMWWKDVVVRKSLFEECAGVKFERMLVAFSTQVLMDKSGSYSRDQLFGLAATIPAVYTDRLLQCRAVRHEWVRRASLLSQRQLDLRALQNMILQGKQNSMLRSLSVDHLRALVKQKYEGVQRRFWGGDQGSSALAYLIRLAGLVLPCFDLQQPERDGKRVYDLHRHNAGQAKNDRSGFSANPSLLPVAAARHPMELKRLCRSVVTPSRKVFRSENTDVETNIIDPDRRALALCADDLLSEKTMHRRLSSALGKIVGAEQKPLEFSRALRSGKAVHYPRIRLWKSAMTYGRNMMQKPIINQDLFERLSLPHFETAEGFGKRIDDVRQGMQKLPQVLDPRALRAMALDPAVLPLPPPLPPPPFSLPQHRLDLRPKTDWHQSETGASDSCAKAGKTQKAKHKPRNSIRASLILSTFGSAEEIKHVVDDEVSKIILATKDDSTEDIDFKTPRSKAPHPNRIWTSGHKKTPIMAMRTPRRSIPMVFEEPPVGLPHLPTTTSTGSMGLLDEGGGMGLEGDSAQESVWDDERSQTSMTLREILLAADTSQLNLIDDEEEEFIEEFSGWE